MEEHILNAIHCVKHDKVNDMIAALEPYTVKVYAKFCKLRHGSPMSLSRFMSAINHTRYWEEKNGIGQIPYKFLKHLIRNRNLRGKSNECDYYAYFEQYLNEQDIQNIIDVGSNGGSVGTDMRSKFNESIRHLTLDEEQLNKLFIRPAIDRIFPLTENTPNDFSFTRFARAIHYIKNNVETYDCAYFNVLEDGENILHTIEDFATQNQDSYQELVPSISPLTSKKKSTKSKKSRRSYNNRKRSEEEEDIIVPPRTKSRRSRTI